MTIDFASDVPDSRARRVWRVHSGCSKTLKWGDMADPLPEVIREAIEIRAWESIVPRKTGKPFPSLLAWLTHHAPDGLQSTPERVEHFIAKDPEVLAMWRKETTGKAGNPNFGNAIHNNIMNSKSQQGTSKAYTVERLSREAPALFRAVCDGEMSANAAAIQAGI